MKLKESRETIEMLTDRYKELSAAYITLVDQNNLLKKDHLRLQNALAALREHKP